MEIKTQNISSTNDVKQTSAVKNKSNDQASFSEELKTLNKNNTKTEESKKSAEKKAVESNDKKDDNVSKAINGLNSAVNELNNPKLRQSDEKKTDSLKKIKQNTDTKNTGDELINNDFEIQKRQDIQAQVSTNLNFSGENREFSSLMNNENNKNELDNSAKDLAEEAEILSTMTENLAMANKNRLSTENKTKTVIKENEITKVNTNSNITVDNIAKFDSVIMDKADVEFFADLVQNGNMNLNTYTSENIKSAKISKTLADMLAKSMEENKPLRIDFDNNISVIIKITREGKISADFLPSSQVAEAYLKENLPLLKQRFDENNINYEELNQRNQRDRERDNNRRKDRSNE